MSRALAFPIDLLASPATLAAVNALIASEGRRLALEISHASNSTALESARDQLRASERARGDLQTQQHRDAEDRQRRVDEAERRAVELQHTVADVLKREREVLAEREHIQTQLRYWDDAAKAIVARVATLQDEARRKEEAHAAQLGGLKALASVDAAALHQTVRDSDAELAATCAAAADLASRGAALGETVATLGTRIETAERTVAALTAAGDELRTRVAGLERELEVASAGAATQRDQLEQARAELSDARMDLRSETSKRECLDTQVSQLTSAYDAHVGSERATNAQLRTELETAHRAHSTLNERAISERETNAAVAGDRKRAEDDLAAARKLLLERAAELAAARTAHESLNAALVDAQERARVARADGQALDGRLKASDASREQLDRTHEKIVAAKAELDKRLGDTDRTLAAVTVERDAARKEVADLTAARADLQSKAAALPSLELKLLASLENALASEGNARLDRQRSEKLAAELETQRGAAASAAHARSALQTELEKANAAATSLRRELDATQLGASKAAETAGAQTAAQELAHKEAAERTAALLVQLREQLEQTTGARDAAARELSERDQGATRASSEHARELEKLRGEKAALAEQVEAGRAASKASTKRDADLNAAREAERRAEAEQKKRIKELEAHVFGLEESLSIKERELREARKARAALGAGGPAVLDAVATPLRGAAELPTSDARGSPFSEPLGGARPPLASVAATEPATAPPAGEPLSPWSNAVGKAGLTDPLPARAEAPPAASRATARVPAARKGREAAKGGNKTRKSIDKAVAAAATSAAFDDDALDPHAPDANVGILDIFDYYPN